MTTDPTDATRTADRADDPAGTSGRPPLVAMVVVGIVMVATLFALFRSGQSATESLLDEEEQLVGPGTVTFDLGTTTLAGEVEHEWILRERCPGWVQLNSTTGDATTVHVVATTNAPDLVTADLVAVDDLATWWADTIGVRVTEPAPTTLLDTPAIAGDLAATPDAPEGALLVACEDADGVAGSGIRGPAAGFEQYAVVTTGPVPDLGTLVVLGAAWVGGDLDLARDDAARLAATLAVEPG